MCVYASLGDQYVAGGKYEKYQIELSSSVVGCQHQSIHFYLLYFKTDLNNGRENYFSLSLLFTTWTGRTTIRRIQSQSDCQLLLLCIHLLTIL